MKRDQKIVHKTFSQEIHFDILFMARWLCKAIHAWKLNKKIGTDRIIKSFHKKIEKNK